MKKITFVRRQYTPYGGGERYLQSLKDEIQKRGVETEMLHLEQPKWMPSWVKFPYYDHQACSIKGERFYFSLDRLSCLDIFNAGGGTHKAFLQTKGFSLNPLHPVYLWMEKRTFENARHIIAVSKFVKEEIVSIYKIPAEKISVVYNGIDIEKYDEAEYRSAKQRIKEKFGLEDGVITFLFVGSGFKRKGGEEFLRILSKIKKPFQAFMVGKEKDLEHYKTLADKLNIAERVVFAGPQKDPRDFYYVSDIFLFPTHYEPFGNVILEAMNFKNLVITTKQCGAGEILESEFLMETPTDYNIVERIESYMDNGELLRLEKEKNYSIVQDYTIEKNADETLRIIEALMKSSETGSHLS